MADAITKELEPMKTILIESLCEFLETGERAVNTNNEYVKWNMRINELADRVSNSHLLYDYYIKTIQDYTINVVKNDLIKLQGEKLLSRFAWRWENHKILVFYIRRIFSYLDRYHVKDFKKATLTQAGLNIFKKEVFDEVSDLVRIALINEITKERESIAIDRDRLKKCLFCFVQMGLSNAEIVKVQESSEKRDRLVWKGNPDLKYYETIFEKTFLEDTRIFFATKSSLYITSLSCPEFLNKAKLIIEQEEERADKLFEPSTKPKLMNYIIDELVANNAQSLADMEGTGCLEMFKHDKRGELRIMFLLFKKRENTLENITSKMGPYIISRGSSIVENQELQQDAIAYTKRLLDFKNEIDSLLEYAFENHHLFQRCRDIAFQDFMNKCPFSAPYIASYCDNEMRKGIKGVSEADIEQRMINIVKLFSCLHDRDIFIRNYTRFLAKRLLDGTSLSDDAEQSMIAKLKVECGSTTVSKIANMYQDIAISAETMAEFKKLSHKGMPQGVALNVQVLRSGCWPEQSTEACMIPPELADCSRTFQIFYVNKHQGRNITWLLGFGQLELITLFASKTFTLIMNPFQAAIVLMFNKGSSYTVSQIREATKLSENTLKANLIMFFNPKNKLFNKESKGKTLEDSETITLNEKFSSPTIRCDFTPKKVKKIEASSKEDEQAISAERKNILDSVIVRIAKARRVIKHQELITEVIRQVGLFRPQPPMIKAQIESLIQREFLARDQNDRTTYNYIP
ncbi:unnamed protein product [Blepharisma stoltei]|uniref:Cullin-5 n=1 Tax=Blepharisma stoltei TaxID=1481888 RepID=A0AAU9IUP5_9CILI|nr:unnamed protein product [Blepharisma stoltei]